MRFETRDDLILFLALEAGRHRLLAAAIEKEASNDLEARDRLLRHYGREFYYRSEIEMLRACCDDDVEGFVAKYRHRWLTYTLLAAV